MIKLDPPFLTFRGDIGDIQGNILQLQMGKTVRGVILKGMKECNCCWSFFSDLISPREGLV